MSVAFFFRLHGMLQNVKIVTRPDLPYYKISCLCTYNLIVYIMLM